MLGDSALIFSGYYFLFTGGGYFLVTLLIHFHVIVCGLGIHRLLSLPLLTQDTVHTLQEAGVANSRTVILPWITPGLGFGSASQEAKSRTERRSGS